jgi:peptide subunit release factor 1 (eRF1)
MKREIMNYEEFSKDQLISIIKMQAKNWLAHDGCWFLAAEEKYGLKEAINIDKESWKRFTVIEAKRIMKEFGIEKESGLDGLEKALTLRLYASINIQDVDRVDPNKIVLKMKTCRVQAARERKNLPHFPCKEVGIVEYSGFANTIDSRIKTKVIACPPDTLDRDYHCGWEFTLSE